MRIDPYLIRKGFPYFQSPEGATIYLDNAATTQKPICVLNAMQDVYIHSCANIHRGNHRLARSAEAAYQQARETVRRFLNARESCEIIFTGGATDSVNLLSQAYCQRHLHERGNLVVTALEHHSNFIPWQQRCRETGAELRIVPVSSSGILDKEEWNRMIDGDTALAVVTGMSNAIGCRLPLEELIKRRMPRACLCWWTHHSSSHTGESTYKSSAAISWFFQATNYMVRRASACCMAKGNFFRNSRLPVLAAA